VAQPALSAPGLSITARFRRPTLPTLAAALAFAVLFARPFALLLDDWWNNPDAGHGLLLAPVAVFLAWKSRGPVESTPAPKLGTLILIGAVLLRLAAGLAAELFTMRISMVAALAGLVVYVSGLGRLRRWWLPFVLFLLSIPLPEVLLNSIALPLQFRASGIGATLLRARHVPVALEGNIINLPNHRLFVTEACSGLRSLTALLSLGVLAGGLWLRFPLSRFALLLVTIPVAVVLNGIRVFLTGFLVFFVDPKLGEGFMHLTEGWLLFLVAFAILGVFAWGLSGIEGRLAPTRATAEKTDD
jgi:exosortase